MNKNKIKISLPSRYRDVHTTLEQTDDPNIFNVVTDGHYTRIIFDGERDVEDRNIKHIDFEGGPFLSLGNTDVYEGYTLKKIISEPEGYKFIFEKNEDKG